MTRVLHVANANVGKDEDEGAKFKLMLQLDYCDPPAVDDNLALNKQRRDGVAVH